MLHAVRILGFAPTTSIAHRYDLTIPITEEVLGDDEARGWVTRSTFAELTGWSLTDSGRQENERRLRVERDLVDPGARLSPLHGQFRGLNARLLRAVTDWQLYAVDGRLVPNDHSNVGRDAATLDELAAIADGLRELQVGLSRLLSRFDGYHPRFVAALGRARAGAPAFVDRTDVDSCHRVWFELHEDLIATLGLTRD